MTEPYLYLHNLLFTNSAWLLSTLSASVSTISSILVILFICRSGKLYSAYHRIMLFMSSWDVVTSFAIALATIPMPSNVHEIYPAFPSWAFGNAVTCTCQGLIIMVGSMYTVWTNCTLNIYYVSTIKYGISEETVNRRILPIMLGFSTVYVCILGGMGLYLGLYNPRPYEPYCNAGPYPNNCIDEEDVECIRGDLSNASWMFITVTVLITGLLILFCTVVSMAMVIVTVLKTELAWREEKRAARARTIARARARARENSNPPSSHDEDFDNTRTALRQALMYIAAFMLTWAWLAISIVSGGGEKVWAGNEALKLFFQPLQGFFNAAIFFAAKVCTLRKSNSRLTKWQAFRQVIKSPWTVPDVIVSQIAAVNDDHRNGSSMIHHRHAQDDEPERLGSDEPSVSVPSNDTPSFDYSRALAINQEGSANSVELKLSRSALHAMSSKGSNAKIEDADSFVDADHVERNEAVPEAHDHNVKNDTTAAKPFPRRKGRLTYGWPPPSGPSSSSTGSSTGRKWNIRCLPKANDVHRTYSGSNSRDDDERICTSQNENKNNTNTPSTTKMNARAASFQELSSAGSSVYCSAANMDDVESGNLPSLPDEEGISFDNDDVHSRSRHGSSADHKSHGGISFAKY